MSRLAVDPAVLASAGAGLIGVGEGLVAAVAALGVSFNASTGQDAAGVVFGRHYQDAGREIMTSVAAGINALLRTGYGVQVSAVNYSRAEANSDLSRRAQALQSPPCPAGVSAAGGPSPLGGGVGEPALWAVVELLVGDVWPNGSVTQMRAAAGAWRSFASVLYGVSGDVAGPYNGVAAQEIPEGEAIQKTIRDIGGVFGQLAMGCEGLAAAVEGFAADVEDTQNAIRRLLATLASIGSIVGIFFEFVRGHGEQELAQIAADIRTVMDHLRGEAVAKKALMAQALADFEALSQVMQIVADREFTEFFGEDVGSVLSGVWRAGGDIDRGIARWTASTVEGVGDLNPVRAFYDPQGAWATWKGLAQMAQVVTNPAADPELTKEIAQGLLRVQEWKTQRPLTALTENLLDVGSAFLGPEAAAGGVAKAGDLADVARAVGRADATTLTGAVGKAGEATRAAGALDGISGRTAELTRSLDKATALPVDKPPALPVEKPLPVTEKPPTITVVERPGPATVGDTKSVGGRPVSPEKPPAASSYPVESHPVSTNPEARLPATPGAPEASATDTVAAPTREHAEAPTTAQQSEAQHPGGLTAEGDGQGRPSREVGGSGHPEGPLGGRNHAGEPGQRSVIGTGDKSPEAVRDAALHWSGDTSAGAPNNPSHGEAPPTVNVGPPPPLPSESPLFDGYHAVDPGPEFTSPDGGLIYPDDTLPSKPYAIPGTVIPDAQLSPGTELQRFGRPTGGWMAPEGTPFAASSLPPASKDLPFYRYEVADPTKLLPGWRIEESLAAPWFHQPGGGPQFRIIAPPGVRPSVESLVEMGYLREVRYGR